MKSNKKNQKRAVVFGGSGFLGSYVVAELVERGWWVRIADLEAPPEELEYEEFVPCDLIKNESFEKVIPAQTDAVYNFAGMSDIDEALNKPLLTMELNVLGNLHILETCRKQKVRHFVYSSSAYACSESGSFYGISKLATEKIIEEYLTVAKYQNVNPSIELKYPFIEVNNFTNSKKTLFSRVGNKMFFYFILFYIILIFFINKKET